MANTKIQIKRTSVAGRTPNTSDPANTSYIAAGEFALNMADKILYTSNGSSLISVGASQDTITATTGNFNNISTDGGISIGNSTVNASINSTSLFAGNAASNVVVNTTILTVSNTTTNSTITSGSIFTGNSEANAQFNIGAGSLSFTINNYSYNSTAGVGTFTTSTNHGLSTPTKGLYVTISGLPTEVSLFNGINEISSLPSDNTFTIKRFIGGQIVSASRTNGVATVTTKSPHGFATNDVVGITGINPDISYANFDFNGSQTIASVPSNTTFTYANYPKINATISSFYVNTSESVIPVYKTGSAHGFATNMPVSTTTTIAATVNSEIRGFFLNNDTAMGPSLSSAAPTIFIHLASGHTASKFSDGTKVSILTPAQQYVSYSSANTTTTDSRIAQITDVRTVATTSGTSGCNFIFTTSSAHGLTVDDYVLTTGIPTGCTTISTLLNSATSFKRIIAVTPTTFTVTAGTTKYYNKAASGDFTNANVYIRIPTNLGIPVNSGRVTIINDDLIRIDGASTTTTVTAASATAWGASAFPKNKIPLFGVSGLYWSRTSNTVRIYFNEALYNVFNVGDYIGVVCYSTNNKDYFKNVTNTSYQLNWSAITAANTGSAWIEFTVDGSKFGGVTSGQFGTSTFGPDYIFRPYKTNTSNSSLNFSRSYINAPIQVINSTAFRIGTAPTTDDALFFSNLGSSSSAFTVSAGAIQANTDRLESQVIVSSGALAGPGSISSTSTTASACTFISPFTQVANSSASVKITASTFYNGNSTSNVFVNSTSFEVATSTNKQITNSSSIILGELSGGVIDTTKPTFFANSTYIQIGPDSSRKFWRAGIIGGVAKTEIGGSEFAVGTEVNNTNIVDSSITLSDGSTSNYIAANGVQLYSNVEIYGPLSISGSYGTAGQILFTDGSNPYWGDVPALNPYLNYTFNGSIVFNGDISGNTTITIDDGLSNYAYVTSVGFVTSSNTNAVGSYNSDNLTLTANGLDTNSTTLLANSSIISVGNSTVNTTINSTAFTGAANNASYLGGTAASGYQTTAGLAANVATLAANSATYVLANSGIVSNSTGVFVKANNGITANATGVFVTQGTGTVVNATGVHVNSSYIGTLSANNASYLGTVAAASYVQNTDSRTLSGNLTFSANITVNGLIANGSLGTAGQYLSSNGSSVYWSSYGSLNYAQNAASQTWANNQSGTTTLAQISITTSGNPVQIFAIGDANPLNAGGWGRLQLWRDSTAIGAQVHFESSNANENVPYALQFIDAPGTGTFTYSIRSNYVTGNTQFGETSGPVISVVELQNVKGATGDANTSRSYTWTNTHSFGNLVSIQNNQKLSFIPTSGGANAYFTMQTDDNFVMYMSSSVNEPRAIWSVYANSDTSAFSVAAPLTLSGNLTLGTVAVSANGSTGSAGQVLTTNGSATYWSTVSGGGGGTVNVAAQYNWTNLHSFSANVSITANAIGLTSNTGAIYFAGTGDANWKIGRNTGATTKFYYTNNSLDIIAANSNLEGIVFGFTGDTYLETGYAGTFTKNPIRVGNSTVNTTINSTAFTGTANNASYLGGTIASAFVANTSGGLSQNSSGIFVVANTGLVVNATGVFVNSSYIATLTANNANNLGGVAAASYVQNTDSRTLSGNLNFTAANVYFSGGLFGSVKPRVNTSTSFANALSWNSDNFEQYISTAQSANLTISADSGSPVNGQKILFRFKDNGSQQTLTFTTGTAKSFRAIGLTLPTATAAGKTLYVGAVYNSDDSRWDVTATAQEI